LDAGTGAEESPNKIYVNSNHDVIMTGFGNFICPSSDQTITTAFWSNDIVNTSDNKINLPDAIKVFPNPSYGKINIEFGGDLNSLIRLMAYDLLGNVVLEKTLSDKYCSMELNLKPGLYFLNFTSEKVSVRKKIVVE
jgi:hypothetical protein